jgi:hypothetical protein
VKELLHAAARGAVAAMAMTGMRRLTVNLGIVEQTPPDAIVKQKSRGLIKMVPRKRRASAVELLHWGYGAGGGIAFALLPDTIRRQPWAGPMYGLAVWFAFELALAPLLGLDQAKKPRPMDRAGLAADHLLYGLVLNEGRAQPQERSATGAGAGP